MGNMRIILFSSLLFSTHLNANSISSDTTYLRYHSLINRAESLFFLDNNVDSALYYYDMAFDEYDFIFIKDLLNAAQISIFHKKPFKKYLSKAFLFGLKMAHLEQFPILKPLLPELESDVDFMNDATISRATYLKSIDFSFLLELYDMGIQDQIDKNKSDDIYAEIKKFNTAKIAVWIENRGFPSAQTIGIDDKNIFGEIGKPRYNIDNRKNQYSTKLEHYSVDDYAFSSTVAIIVLIHNQCTFVELKEILHNAMIKGEIHPREIGLLYDNMFRWVNSRFYSCRYPKEDNGVFFLNPFYNYYYKDISVFHKKVNKIRSEWNIVPIEVDEQKRRFQEEFGFKLFYGFWKCM